MVLWLFYGQKDQKWADSEEEDTLFYFHFSLWLHKLFLEFLKVTQNGSFFPDGTNEPKKFFFYFNFLLLKISLWNTCLTFHLFIHFLRITAHTISTDQKERRKSTPFVPHSACVIRLHQCPPSLICSVCYRLERSLVSHCKSPWTSWQGRFQLNNLPRKSW